MKTLAIDIETYSSVSLQKCGVYAYASSPDFEILLFGYAWDDGPVEVIDMASGQKLPQELQDALYDPEILKTAFNASFERTCLSAFMGRVTPPEQWSCTAVMARELGLPGSLEMVGQVIGLPEDKQKSKTGKALIRYFSIPCKATKVNGGRTRNLPQHDPDRWKLYVEYNRQDVEAERAIRHRLQKFPVLASEQDLYVIDQNINDRGVGVDTTLAAKAVEIDQIVKARLLDEAKDLTGLDNPKSATQLKSWIEEVSGYEVESLNKKMIGAVRTGTDNEAVHAMLDIRQSLSKTSTEKYSAIDSANKVSDAVSIVMLEHSRHPVREYLQGLQWDGTKRADTLFVDYLGADDTEYVRTVTRKSLIGAVARIMAPGCKHDHTLVLVGPQGCRKSTTLAKLGKSWFSDSLYTVSGKEAYEQLQGFWIIEVAELAAFSGRKTELEQIKQFLSKQSDSYRAAYARRTQERLRQCAFFGTTNDDEFLKDPTGGRRFWPVIVKGAERSVADALDEEVIDQVWAEIVMRYNAGEVWWLDDKMEEEAKKIQDAHTEQNGKQGLIEKFLDTLLPENWDRWDLDHRRNFWEDGFEDESKGTVVRMKVCALEIWQELFKGDVKAYTQLQAREINNILRRLPGWKSSTSVDCGEPYGRQRGFIRESSIQGSTLGSTS